MGPLVFLEYPAGMLIAAFGDRSVSLVLRNYDRGDLLTFSTIREALLSAGAMRPSTIVEFLSTKRETAEQTVLDLARHGAMVQPLGIGFTRVCIADANTFDFDTTEVLSLRISLASSSAA